MESAGKEKKILIVDDSVIARMGIKKIIDGKGFNIIEASNGIEALSLIKKENPDMILMDYLMPELTGMEVLQTIRGENNNIPVIIISANQQEATLNKFKELNVLGVIKKHPDKEKILSLIDSAFNTLEDN